MANIVDTSFFYGELHIGQITDPSVQSSLIQFIDHYEPRFLNELLGYELNKLRVAAPGDERFLDILNGKEFTDNSNLLTKWPGLKTTAKKSPIANYVYYWYQRSKMSETTGSGEKIPVGQSSVNHTPAFKMIKVWNDMVEWNAELVNFLWTYPLIYPEFTVYNPGSSYTLRDVFVKMNNLFL